MKKLLIVVDMQKDFIDGSLGTGEAAAIVPRVKKKIEEYEAAGDEVIFTLDTHGEDYPDSREGKKLPVVHCVKGTAGWELDASLSEFQGKRFEKNTFGSTAVGEYVKEKEYESIELVGLCTDICVISNALLVRAFLPETPIVVDSLCCAGVTPESHENALNAMKACQIEIL
ncbi:isochorismatase family cysteine hydrolase [Lachnospiraceae bacterium 54-53]